MSRFKSSLDKNFVLLRAKYKIILPKELCAVGIIILQEMIGARGRYPPRKATIPIWSCITETLIKEYDYTISKHRTNTCGQSVFGVT